MHRETRARCALLWAGLVLSVLAACEVLGLLGLMALSKLRGVKYDPVSVTTLPLRTRTGIEEALGGGMRYLALSPTLGWTVRRGGAAGPYRANAQGLRADRDYTPVPPAGFVRVAAFGDSFTHGDDVPNAQTWTRQLELRDPRLEVLNFGVMGYAPDQALLRYVEDGRRFQPHVVLMGLIPENVCRIVNVFRPFYAGRSDIPLAKPRFVLEGDRLVLLPNPLPQWWDYQRLLREPAAMLPTLGAHDAFFRTKARVGPFELFAPVQVAKLLVQEMSKTPADRFFRNDELNPDSEAFRLLTRLLDEFRAGVLRDGSVPVVVLFPERQDILRYRRLGTRRNEPLVQHLRRSHHLWLDLTEDLSATEAGAVADIVGGHYTADGNAIVARALHTWLAREALLDVEGCRQARVRLETPTAPFTNTPGRGKM